MPPIAIWPEPGRDGLGQFVERVNSRTERGKRNPISFVAFEPRQ